MATNKYANVTLGTTEAVFNKMGGVDGIEAFLRGETKIVPNEAIVKEETPINTLIRVDRSVRPTYPNWTRVVMHPELESTGSGEYDLAARVQLWLHDKQKNSVVAGQVIYEYLKRSSMLESCGNLQDALAIQRLGVTAFKKVFGNKAIYFWKSVVQGSSGRLNVPYLCVNGDEVVLCWRWLGHDWIDYGPALLFAR